MASTTVVNNGFFSRLTDALRSMQSDPKIGEFSLAMLVPSKVYDDQWSLVVASKELDKLRPFDATHLVLAWKRQLLGDESAKIDTVRVLPTDHPAVQDLGSAFQIPQIGTTYQAHGMLPLYLNLEEPILFVAKAA